MLYTKPSREVSANLHDRLQVGDLLEVSNPVNGFPLSLQARKSVFIAGGIGITPFITMMEAENLTASASDLHFVDLMVYPITPSIFIRA